ncbi:MAG TPA: VOC family protein [Gemmatimonadales bacterium]|nr:VOC family protein [Gemmatimonadales bacterium]
MSPITPFLWFDGRAEEAMQFYTAIFPNSRILSLSRAGAAGPVISGTFELAGRPFMALNGGPTYQFTPAISLFVSCRTQAEIDDYWDRLLAGGGEPTRCGWLKDRFGLSWQVVPTVLGRLLGDPDREKAGRAMQAMLQMVKLDIAALERAFEGRQDA